MPLSADRDDLVRERTMSTSDVWDAAELRLDRPVAEGLNLAHECCDRWAGDRSRLGMIVAHQDGGSDRWTFADISELSRRFANVLVRAGLRPGDRVAAVVGRQIEAFACAIGCWRAGMVFMPLFAGFGEHALAQRLNAAQVGGIIVDQAYRPIVERARGMLTNDPAIWCVAGPRGSGLVRGDYSLWAELDQADTSFAAAPTAASDPAILMFTSGTTGAPKGCVMPHGLILAVQPFTRHVYALTESDLMFSAADPGWSYGLVATGISVMALGMPRVIYSGAFDPSAWLAVCERERVTYPSAAPSAFRRIGEYAIRHPLPAGIRGATCAGEPLDAPLVERWQGLGAGPIQDGYGSTEMGMLLANLAFDDRPIVPGAMSSIVPGFEVALVDDKGNEVEDQGIIATRGSRYSPSVGYWNEPEKWQARWRGEWHLSGDVARREEDGRWRFIGRDDDLIVSSGYNIGPAEVENIVLAIPGVRDAAVVAAPDAARGSVVRAVVVRAADADEGALTKAIQDAVRAQLGRHAYPRVVDFTTSLPRTETGKLKRAELRAVVPS